MAKGRPALGASRTGQPGRAQPADSGIADRATMPRPSGRRSSFHTAARNAGTPLRALPVFPSAEHRRRLWRRPIEAFFPPTRSPIRATQTEVNTCIDIRPRRAHWFASEPSQQGEPTLPATRHLQVEREWCPVTRAAQADSAGCGLTGWSETLTRTNEHRARPEPPTQTAVPAQPRRQPRHPARPRAHAQSDRIPASRIGLPGHEYPLIEAEAR